MEDIIANPTHVISNFSISGKAFKPNSFLFAKTNGKAEIIVVEVNKIKNRFEAVTGFIKTKRDFNKIQQASLDAGGSAFRTSDGRSLIVPPGESGRLAASRISALQRQELPIKVSIARPKKPVKPFLRTELPDGFIQPEAKALADDNIQSVKEILDDSELRKQFNLTKDEADAIMAKSFDDVDIKAPPFFNDAEKENQFQQFKKLRLRIRPIPAKCHQLFPVLFPHCPRCLLLFPYAVYPVIFSLGRLSSAAATLR